MTRQNYSNATKSGESALEARAFTTTRIHETALAKMPQSEEAAMWFSAVYQAVQEVPYGKVTSYGHIAILLGYRELLQIKQYNTRS